LATDNPNPGKPELNIEYCRLKICGIASDFAFGYDPTGRSVYYITVDLYRVSRIEYPASRKIH